MGNAYPHIQPVKNRITGDENGSCSSCFSHVLHVFPMFFTFEEFGEFEEFVKLFVLLYRFEDYDL